ncbi:uncharacterized protein LOC115724662 isoform X2 [Cannabis sativa]|uniref:uncharacterized protein LOC115724662 isoform X2 n=1 Tax=Cannabis sativa TaxID=3483 RepID=UPI0029C9D3F7|nr:uncharacterized protein LOC115724662 isoform X2 [Cannabis sativa]
MVMMLRGHGSAAIGFSSFASSSSSSSSSSSYLNQNAKPSSLTSPTIFHLEMVCKQLTIRTSNYACFAVQESSTSTATDENKEAKPAKKAAPAKPKAKAPVKALPEMMKEEVIPSLKSILEAQDDVTDIELSFQDNKLEGSFAKKGNPYSFWAFFPDGVLTGPKGFSLSSYGGEVSTVEPFLIDEKKITARHVVFWVEKRLAAQGIIPVWND